MTEEPGFTSSTLVRRIVNEDALIRHRADATVPSAFAAIPSTKEKVHKIICSNRKRTSHTVDFCVRPGGKMAGCSIEEATSPPPGSRTTNRLSLTVSLASLWPRIPGHLRYITGPPPEPMTFSPRRTSCIVITIIMLSSSARTNLLLCNQLE
jgi:hypothetical protein